MVNIVVSLGVRFSEEGKIKGGGGVVGGLGGLG